MTIETGPLKLIPGHNCEKFALIGSQVIPGAATEKSDTDVAVLAVEFADHLHSVLMDEMSGENSGSNEGTPDGMESYKVEMYDSGHVWNYLVFTDMNYFYSFINATTIARHFGVTDKPTRVALFQMICDGDRGSWMPFEHIEIHRMPVAATEWQEPKAEEGAPF